MNNIGEYTYIPFNGERFFTVTLLPDKHGQFPTVILRSPYVSALEHRPEEEIVEEYHTQYTAFTQRGYAVVIQHCRGQGKSSGAFIPYECEHEDGRALREWIRQQSFYNGELYLFGGSYTASLHYASAPFEEDIKGAVFEVQDTERYRLWYRNGQMRKGHANWHFDLYKPKCGLIKTHSMRSFSALPLKGLSKRVLGEDAIDFEQMLEAPHPDQPFWQTRNGGVEAKEVTNRLPFPALFTTGYFDFYVGGMLAMWNAMDENTRARCAMLVSPYDHSDRCDPTRGLSFPNGTRHEQFGAYALDWFDHIRNGQTLPYTLGHITYYRMFENVWEDNFYGKPTVKRTLPLGNDTVTFAYDPQDPPHFPAEGMLLEKEPRNDVITLYAEPLDRDLFVKGKMELSLCVSSDCPDTSFYVGIGIQKANGDYRLRHDITSLAYQLGAYRENEAVTLTFSFDEIAFLLKRGERLRVDITATDDNAYVCHTNRVGPYHEQTDTTIAHNTVFLENSYLQLPIEKDV